MKKYVTLLFILTLIGCETKGCAKHTFKNGDLIKHKLSGESGMVVRLFYYPKPSGVSSDYFKGLPYNEPLYTIRFNVPNKIGTDTAAGAGSGFGGSTKIEHFSPSSFSDVICQEFEIELIKE